MNQKVETNYKIYGLRVIGTNEIRYVGYTKRSLKVRLSRHFYEVKCGRTYKKCNWIRKNNYQIEIVLLEENLSYEQALERECFHIGLHKNLVNSTTGGKSNPMQNPEVRLRHTEAMKKYKYSRWKEKYNIKSLEVEKVVYL